MAQYPWTKYQTRHERSFTYGNQQLKACQTTARFQLQTNPRWLKSETNSLEGQMNSHLPRPNLKKKEMEIASDMKDRKDRIKWLMDTNNMMNLGIPTPTNRENELSEKSQKSDKSARELSRDLQKVQKFIEIDNDIIKTQINNINAQNKNKRELIELENKMLADKVRKMQILMIDNTREITKSKQFVERIVKQFQLKFKQQIEINILQDQEVKFLKERVRNLEGPTSTTPSQLMGTCGLELSERQIYENRIRELENQLSLKSNELEQYQTRQLQNSIQFRKIRYRGLTFSQSDKSKQQIGENCEELIKLCSNFIEQQDQKQQNVDVYKVLNQKLVYSIQLIKEIMSKNGVEKIRSRKQSDFKSQQSKQEEKKQSELLNEN